MIKGLDELKKQMEKEAKEKKGKLEVKDKKVSVNLKKTKIDEDEKRKENEKEEEIYELSEEELKEIEKDILKQISSELNIRDKQAEAVINLLNEGNTIPFIARYRKEQTGSMSDELLREFDERLAYLRNINKRKIEVKRLIAEQGKLTEQIEKDLEKAKTLTEVEDIYRPYKKKRKTRASEAKRKGLEALSEYIFSQKYCKEEILKKAEEFFNDEVKTTEEALQGALDIIAENISDNPKIRKMLKQVFWKLGFLDISRNEKVEDEKELYKMYYDFKENIKHIPSHRILASNRGEKEKILKISLELPEDEAEQIIYKQVIKESSKCKELMKEVSDDSYSRLIKPSIEREIRAELKEKADKDAINIFSNNLKQLILAPPFKDVNILGFDPAYRTGCKLASIDSTGKLLGYDTIFPTPPQNRIEESRKILENFIQKYNINIIAIGNGTASRESEKFVADTIKGMKDVSYIIVNEAGASVYSASKIGTEEFPDINVSIRGAISIARRVLDPMAELVKIDPKSIGVGQYQHDVDQKNLQENLNNVLEDAVNSVGVDLNTATFSLLEYVAGLSKRTAKNIVKFRDKEGKIESREELKKVSGIGEVSFNQSAGFLRIYDGKNPLEETGIHPESYEVAENVLKEIGYKLEDLKDEKLLSMINIKLGIIDTEKTAKKLKIGEPTLIDIILELKKPGRDIRDEAPKPVLRQDILTIDDIMIGTILKGTVRNITAFGAFVDIGVDDDGLVHISQMSDKFVKEPNEIVSVGDIVTVKVIDKDEKTGKIGLSMKGV